MTYATKADMVSRFGEKELAQLTNRVNGKTIDDSVVNQTLADTDSIINGYLAERYSVPVQSQDTQLVRCACDIARYYLFSDKLTEVVRQRYEDAIALLKDIQRNKYQLVDAISSVATSAGSINDASFFTAQKRVFGGVQ